MPTYVLSLDSPDLTLERGGGKAANLSRLARAGLPVPTGFVVTTDAYRAAAAAGPGHEVALALADASADRPESLDAASTRILAAFERAILPDALAAEIRLAYQALAPDPPAVAVRSSATAEDLPAASFAGQQETYLNVRGEVALLDAIRRCWASLWTARAMAYRARLGIPPSSVALAVVVQRMVPAEASGILFTVNPTSGRADEVVIEAAWGLGEAVVAGRTSPDNLVVEKETGQIRSATIGEKSLRSAPAAGGTVEVEVAPNDRGRLSLTPEQAALLAGLGRDIEDLFGAPQDVEWAIAEGVAHILQSRPITAAAAPEDDDWPPHFPPDAAMPYDRWTHADVGERWPDPVTPLTWSTWEPLTDQNMRYTIRGPRPHSGAEFVERVRWSRRAFGRVYLNEGALAHAFAELYGFPTSISSNALGSGLDASVGSSFQPRRFLRRLPTFLAILGMRLKNEGVYVEYFDQIDRWVRESQARDLSSAPDADLWDEVESVWLPRVATGINLHADATSSALVALPMLEGLCERWLGGKELAGQLLGGMTGVVAAEMPVALWRIAREIERAGLSSLLAAEPAEALARLRSEPEAREAIALLDRFLDRHGHRCASEAEWANPRWAEAPELVLGAIRAYVGASTPDPAEDVARQRRLRTSRLAEAARQLGPVRWGPFRLALARTERLVRLRDNGQHFVVRLALPMRRIFATLGARWADRGWIERPDDVFYLVLPEMARLAREGEAACREPRPQATIAGRRRARERWLGTSAPGTLGPDGTPLAAGAQVSGDSILRGVGASGGRATGPARIILDPVGLGSLRRGEILVTRSTDPGWTPAFPLVGGLVVEVGGQLSHAAIVAREYGLPAVVGVPGATRRIRDGQVITVDGSAGSVTVD